MSVLGGIIYYNEKTYSPLKATDFQKLFPNYRGNADKIYGKDFIGLSFHNELFELYLYKMMENVSINENYPKFGEWEKNEIVNKKENSSTWKKCPMDIKEKEKFKDVIASEVFEEDMHGKNFRTILNDTNNYYTYVYINELEYYFFLFNKDKEELYYIRKAGKINNFKRIKPPFRWFCVSYALQKSLSKLRYCMASEIWAGLMFSASSKSAMVRATFRILS